MKTILGFVLLVIFALALSGAALAQELETDYSMAWEGHDCYRPVSWVGLTFIHPTLRKEDLKWTVLYIQQPGLISDTRVFYHVWEYTNADGDEVHFMDVVYTQPDRVYSLKACVYDLTGGEYCTAEDLVPDCPFSLPRAYIPVVVR